MNSKNNLSFLFGTFIGVICFICIYGVKILDFTYTDWLLHSNDIEGSIDLTQHYLGWVFYRNTPWQFPLGLTEGIYWDNISVIYTDSIPLFAFIFKLLSPILPSSFQYFGFYGLLCYGFMGGFSALLIRKFSDSKILIIVGSLLFTLNPVLLNRMFLHTALSAHFLLICGFCLWAYRKDLSTKHSIIGWSVLLTCGTLINAYFTPMLLGTLLCCLLEQALREKSLKGILTAIIIPMVSLICCSYLLGMFYGDVPSGSTGLEVLSFNLNGLINPFTYFTDFGAHYQGYRDMNYSLFLPALSLSTAFQSEGFSYLGLGVITLILILLFVGILQKRFSISKLKTPLGISLVLFTVVFVFLALSPKCTLGEKVVYYIHYPDAIYQMLSTFRSTARFIWPVYYFIITVAIICFGRWFKDNLQKSQPIIICLLCGVLCLQIIDLLPGYKEKYVAFHSFSEYSSPLQSDAWEVLGTSADKIIFYPDTEYGLYLDCETSTNFQIYALKYDLSLNNTYMSRNLCDLADEKTMEHFASRSNGDSYNYIYIFFDDTNVSALPESYHLNYYNIDGYTVGTELDLSDYANPIL